MNKRLFDHFHIFKLFTFQGFLKLGEEGKVTWCHVGSTGVDSYRRVELYLIVCMSVKQGLSP